MNGQVGTDIMAVSNGKFVVAENVIRRCRTFGDKALAVANSVGFDFCFALIANGVTDEQLAVRLGLLKNEMKMILTSNPMLRKKYMDAKSFNLADASVEMLEQYSMTSSMCTEEKYAMDMHSKNLDRVMKTEVEENKRSGVVINNILSVRTENDIPEPPSEFGEFIDMALIDEE